MRSANPHGDDAARSGLDRRDMLKILAGVPLALGLPALAGARADDDPPAPPAPPADGCDAAPPPAPVDGAAPGVPATARAIGEAVRRARAEGRPVLLVAVPALDSGAGWAETYSARQRVARRLASFLASDDIRTRLAFAHTVVIVAAKDEIGAALPLPATAGKSAAGPVAVWLVDAASGGSAGAGTLKPAERLDGAGASLVGEDADATRLAVALADRIFGADGGTERLAARRDYEMGALDAAARGEVERALAALADASWDVREAAAKALAARRDAILSTLALGAMTSADPEVRARCAVVATPRTPSAPLGTQWAEFHTACGVSDPYSEAPSPPCGMAEVTAPARTYLRLLSR